MKLARDVAVTIMVCVLLQLAAALDLPQIEAVWQQTLDALNRGDNQAAKSLFADFNQKVRAYVSAHGLKWQLEYLIGTLDCRFPDSRASGVEYLKDSLQNSRGLNAAGAEELNRQIAACTAPVRAATLQNTHPDVPLDIASAHYQSPG